MTKVFAFVFIFQKKKKRPGLEGIYFVGSQQRFQKSINKSWMYNIRNRNVWTHRKLSFTKMSQLLFPEIHHPYISVSLLLLLEEVLNSFQSDDQIGVTSKEWQHFSCITLATNPPEIFLPLLTELAKLQFLAMSYCCHDFMFCFVFQIPFHLKILLQKRFKEDPNCHINICFH